MWSNGKLSLKCGVLLMIAWYAGHFKFYIISSPAVFRIHVKNGSESGSDPLNCLKGTSTLLSPWDKFFFVNEKALYSKVNLKSYCTHFFYCPVQLCWLDFTALYRLLRSVTQSLLFWYEPKWREGWTWLYINSKLM